MKRSPRKVGLRERASVEANESGETGGYFFFFQAEDGIRDIGVTGVQTCALPIFAPWGHSLPEALWSAVTGQPTEAPVRGDHWVTLTLAGVLATELVGVLLLSWVRTARTRRRHRELLELVVRPASLPMALPSTPPDARLLEHPAPVAFCIPGARPLLVLSSGMVAELDDAQLAAVVAHERAHLREHHHLYLLPFVAWEAALPVLPAAGRAHAAVRTLVEMRAEIGRAHV